MNLVGSVGLATGYGLNDKGRSSSPAKVMTFLFCTSFRPVMGFMQHPVSPVANLPGREADHSPPTSAEVAKYLVS
jgi:hypothetical protein